MLGPRLKGKKKKKKKQIKWTISGKIFVFITFSEFNWSLKYHTRWYLRSLWSLGMTHFVKIRKTEIFGLQLLIQIQTAEGGSHSFTTDLPCFHKKISVFACSTFKQTFKFWDISSPHFLIDLADQMALYLWSFPYGMGSTVPTGS